MWKTLDFSPGIGLHSNMSEYKDLFNKEIKVGDYIVYAANDGRCGVLRIGKVVELTVSKEEDYYTKKKSPKIRAKSACYRMVDYDTREYGWQKQKDVSLGFFERLVVMDENAVPEDARKILDL
jgi:hypothetical protein